MINPQHRVLELLREHNFDLVRQRKHKIYKNPEGMMFVVASTPSDWRASYNSLATLKRILRQNQSTSLATGRNLPEGKQTPHLMVEPECVLEAELIIENEARRASIETTQSAPQISRAQEIPLSEQEWETWKRQHWRDESLLVKNEKFLSIIEKYVTRLSELIQRGDIEAGPATDGLKSVLREMQYRSKVLIYNCKFFDKGIVVFEGVDQPILWASNGHIGISSFLYFGSYVQHLPAKLPQIRFVWNGFPVLFERPQIGSRKFSIRIGKSLGLSKPQ